MKIEFNNGSIDIDLTEEYNGTNHVYKIYVDDINNYNMISSNDDDHYIVFLDDYSMEEPIDLDVTNYKLSAAIVTVHIHDDSTQEDTTITKFTLDEEFLYYNILNMVVNTCSRCLNKVEKQRMVMCNLRWELLKYAMKHELIIDSVKRYKDLIKILGIDDNPCPKYIDAESRSADFVWNGGTVTGSCFTCKGDCCSVCRKADAPMHRWIDVE